MRFFVHGNPKSKIENLKWGAFTMSYEIGDRVIVNMRNLNPDLISASLLPEVRGTVIENPSPGLYHVRLDDPIEGYDILMDLGEDRLMPYPPPFEL